mmetsp:Transcript_72021/g.113773  ORF Transcript_72021/g.113773 Transcript_72021/m.113773 type:complete len:83 (-) Transcript_72021:12-260(-)
MQLGENIRRIDWPPICKDSVVLQPIQRSQLTPVAKPSQGKQQYAEHAVKNLELPKDYMKISAKCNENWRRPATHHSQRDDRT